MNFQEYQAATATTAIYPREIGLAYVALGLAGEAGEIANKVKKIYRDNGGVLTPEKAAVLKDELSDVLWYVSQLATEIDTSLESVAIDNISKLTSRKERGTLMGEGDNR